MAELWLVCEGEPNSIDVGVLQPLFARVLPTEIVVEPACGSIPSVVARFLEIRRGGRAAFLNDRDYRLRTAAEATLTDGRAGFLWRRHSIENYLLEPRVVVRAFNRLRQRFVEQKTPVPPWLTGPLFDLGMIAEGMKECAQRRAAEEAGRLATERLWAALPVPLGNVQKRFPTPFDTSALTDPRHWREAMCVEAENLCTVAGQTATCPQFQRAQVGPLFDAAYGEITAAAYIDGMEFLLDYHGRDLLSEFLLWLRARGVRLSNERLIDELIPALVEEYQINRTLFGRDDFLDLANGVRSLAGLPALT